MRFVGWYDIVQGSGFALVRGHVVVILLIRNLVLIVDVVEIHIIVRVAQRPLRGHLLVGVFNVIKLVILYIELSIVLIRIIRLDLLLLDSFLHDFTIILHLVKILKFFSLNFVLIRGLFRLLQRFVRRQVSGQNINDILLEGD